MPPEAEPVLRQRKRLVDEEDDDDDAPLVIDVPSSNSKRRCLLQNLKGSEICIDGVIYDIADFDHPGGGTIRSFGGNDVTIHYRMIHPYHTSKHLDKMKRVGTVVDFQCEYKFETPFERDVKKEVFKVVHRGREFGTLGYCFRAVVYIVLFFALQYAWAVTGSSYTLAVLFGLSSASIGLNIQHDANHGAVSKKPWINELLGFSIDFIGGNKWMWFQLHWMHHAYTNLHGKDPDSSGAEPFLVFNHYPPGHPARTWLHRFQVLYYLPILACYWILSVFNPRLPLLKHGGAEKAGFRVDDDFVRPRRKYAALFRVYYMVVNLATPFLHHGMHWVPLTHVFLYGTVFSLALAIPFTLSHIYEDCERDPTSQLRKTGEPVCWFKSQVETSSTYGGFVSGCLTGGLNFQVEHHLFPRMSSAWYPYIAPTVRAVCKKHGVRYQYYPWVWQNLISTLKHTHQAGTGSHFWVTDPLSGES